jgi:hypothetical protein
MKHASLVLLVTALTVFAQNPSPGPAPSGPPFENPPILSASAILLPQFLQGPNFQVTDPVPTVMGANEYTITSDFGVFTANGNDMLMRRVAEINAIAILQNVSSTQEFQAAAAKAAQSPLVAARNLVTNPIGTISGVQRGLWKFLNQAGQSVKEIGEGRQPDALDGNLVTNAVGYSKVKRDIALKLGVDPYSTNATFQQVLDKVAWPMFAGGFTVDLGMAALSAGIGTAGTVLSAVNLTGTLNDMLRDNSPTELRLINLKILLGLGVDRAAADAFLNNNAISPTTQTIMVSALGQLSSATGVQDFIVQATTCAGEEDALFFQQSAQLMALLNASAPVTLITHLNGLPICQVQGGQVVVPLGWDYALWTASTERFLAALRTQQLPAPATGYAVMISGVFSPAAAKALTMRSLQFSQLQLPGPLK